MTQRHVGTSGPDPAARLALIDALRGAALFGVLLINMLWFAGQENTLSREQFSHIAGAAWADRADYWISMLAFAKSIGIFAFLFGVGFGIQMRNLDARGPDAHRIYQRRLIGLLIIGFVHWMGVWSGDVLHAYALAGFLLLCCRRWSTGWLIGIGVPLAILARPIFGRLAQLLGRVTAQDVDLAQRLAVFQHGSFADIVRLQFFQDCLPDFTSGALIAAIMHALGRFMVGAAVYRRGYLSEPERYRSRFTVIALACIVPGFILQHDWVLTNALVNGPLHASKAFAGFAGHACNSLGVVLMTVGYVCAFARLWLLAPARRWLSLLAPMGRMALTQYLLQTVCNYLLFCGFGLGLMGKVGIVYCIPLSAGIFVTQLAVSHWWLRHFKMGPAEWLWRWWTYGYRPAFRG